MDNLHVATMHLLLSLEFGKHFILNSGQGVLNVELTLSKSALHIGFAFLEGILHICFDFLEDNLHVAFESF